MGLPGSDVENINVNVYSTNRCRGSKEINSMYNIDAHIFLWVYTVYVHIYT